MEQNLNLLISRIDLESLLYLIQCKYKNWKCNFNVLIRFECMNYSIWMHGLKVQYQIDSFFFNFWASCEVTPPFLAMCWSPEICKLSKSFQHGTSSWVVFNLHVISARFVVLKIKNYYFDIISQQITLMFVVISFRSITNYSLGLNLLFYWLS